MSCVFVYRSICSNLTWYQILDGQGTFPPWISYWIIFLFCKYNFEMNSSVPLLTRSSDYFEWKVKMIIFLKRQDLLWVYYGFGRKSFESENDWLNAKDVACEIMKLALSPSFPYLSRSTKDPEELWTRLDRTFEMIYEDHNSTLERTSSTIRFPDTKLSASTLYAEVVQNKKRSKVLL